ncbi:MAG: M81 family metallopeptidase [Erysipelotrichaceae bacterium]
MKVLVGEFGSESNEHSRSLMTMDKFIFKYGEELINSMNIRDIFEVQDIELIASISAMGHPHGPVTLDAYEYILSYFLNTIKEHLHEIDGIFLHLHGASKVIGLEGGSAEHAIVREIRKITGPYLPIALVMDPHGNLSNELVEKVNILRCYRNSPHTDIEETYRFVAEKLVDILKRRRDIRPIYYQIPIIIGGEKSVSSDEPVRSINRLCDEAEATGRIMSASFHIGYLRHDGDKLGCSVVVVPNTAKDKKFADDWAKKIRAFVYSRRHEFHYHGNVEEPQSALNKIVGFSGTPCFLTDSGDNVGSGADGFNTFVLRQIIELDDLNNKRFLIAGIVDQNAYMLLYHKKVGEHVEFDLGTDFDELCKKVHVKGTIVARGLADPIYKGKEDIGTAITVQFDDKQISVIIEFDAIQYVDCEQFESSGLNVNDYDVFVVKEGYISDDYEKFGKLCIMSLTDGPTYQKSENLIFKRIKRPMFPYDDLELSEIDGE